MLAHVAIVAIKLRANDWIDEACDRYPRWVDSSHVRVRTRLKGEPCVLNDKNEKERKKERKEEKIKRTKYCQHVLLRAGSEWCWC